MKRWSTEAGLLSQPRHSINIFNGPPKRQKHRQTSFPLASLPLQQKTTHLLYHHSCLGALLLLPLLPQNTDNCSLDGSCSLTNSSLYSCTGLGRSATCSINSRNTSTIIGMRTFTSLTLSTPPSRSKTSYRPLSKSQRSLTPRSYGKATKE